MIDSSTAVIQNCWNRIGVWGTQSCSELPQYVHCRNCSTYLRAASEILDREVSAEYFAQYEDETSIENSTDRGETYSLMVFRLGSERLALLTKSCSEVSDPGPIHSIPHRNNQVVQGIVNIRGELLICIDLAQILGIEMQVSAERGSRFIVYGDATQRLVFPVNEVYGVQRISSAEISVVPSTVAKASHPFTNGVFIWGKYSIGVLSDESLIEHINRRLS